MRADQNLKGKITQQLENIIEDNLFWYDIEGILSMFRPFAVSLDILQSNHARLVDIVHQFSTITYMFTTTTNPYVASLPRRDITEFIRRLERRWYQWEQPLLLLAKFFHPSRLANVNTEAELVHFQESSRINITTLSELAAYYYEAWTGIQARNMKHQISKYYLRRSPFDNNEADDFRDDMVLYWDMIANDHQEFEELCFVARRLQIIGVNSASCERLFSDMGYIHSKRRNRLSFEKVLHIAQVRSNLKKKRQMEQMSGVSKRGRHSSTATTVATEEAAATITGITTEDNIATIDTTGATDSAENEGLNVEEQLIALTTEWTQTLDEEESLQDEEDILDFHTHIAEKQKYKWKLASLFSCNVGRE